MHCPAAGSLAQNETVGNGLLHVSSTATTFFQSTSLNCLAGAKNFWRASRMIRMTSSHCSGAVVEIFSEWRVVP